MRGYTAAGKDIMDDDIKFGRWFALFRGASPRCGLADSLGQHPPASVGNIDLLRVLGLEPKVRSGCLDHSSVYFNDRRVETMLYEGRRRDTRPKTAVWWISYLTTTDV